MSASKEQNKAQQHREIWTDSLSSVLRRNTTEKTNTLYLKEHLTDTKKEKGPNKSARVAVHLNSKQQFSP